MDLPQEPPAVIENSRAPAYWPSSSNNDSLVVVENLEVKYAPELPAVLHDVSFKLRAGERVGLLGRTGWFLSILLEWNLTALRKRKIHVGDELATIRMFNFYFD